MDNCMITIITVCYNAVDSIEKTIQSVVNQTFDSIQYVVIDGGSTDGTLDIINAYKTQIDTIVSEPDNGIYDAMNKGIAFAKGHYCIFMNAGDLFYHTTTLFNIKEEFQKGYELIYGRSLFFSPNEGIEFLFGRRIELSDFYFKMPICHQSIFFKTSKLKELGGYDINFRIKADHEWLLRFFSQKKYKALFVDEIISRYHMIGYAVTNKLKSIQEFKKISRLHLPTVPRVSYEIRYPFLWLKYKTYDFIRGTSILAIYRKLKYNKFWI